MRIILRFIFIPVRIWYWLLWKASRPFYMCFRFQFSSVDCYDDGWKEPLLCKLGIHRFTYFYGNPHAIYAFYRCKRCNEGNC